MEFVQKIFDELTNRELYEILRAREAVVSDPFLEDGIPHVQMRLQLVEG